MQDRQITTQVPKAANHTDLMTYCAMKAVDMLYRTGYNFYKGGVIVDDIVPSSQVQGALWDEEGKPVNMALMKAMDGVNGY